jgi:drug efflux transport system ATP-binding protein
MEEAEFCDRLVLIFQGRLIAQGTPRDLKNTVPDEVLAVYPDHLGQSLDILRQLPLFGDVAVFGDGLHLTTAHPERAETEVRKALAAHGIAVRALHRVKPNLEDAFISLIERAGNEKQGIEKRD